MKRKSSYKKTTARTPRYQKKMVLVPRVIKKHKTATAGLAALGLGIATGILLYNRNHKKHLF